MEAALHISPKCQGSPLRFTIWLRNHSLRTAFSYRFSSIRRNSTFPGRAAWDPKVAPKWIHKGSQRGRTVDPKWTQRGPKMDPLLDQKGTKRGPLSGPKGDQKGTPFGPKRGPILVTLLVPKGPPFWSPFGPERVPIWAPLLAQKGTGNGPGINTSRDRADPRGGDFHL